MGRVAAGEVEFQYECYEAQGRGVIREPIDEGM
jgi:hypothetical protein